jgi:hypothetical protein
MVPEGKKSGESFVAQTPDGRLATIIVPEGAVAGQPLSVDVTADVTAGATSIDPDETDLAQQLREIEELGALHRRSQPKARPPMRAKIPHSAKPSALARFEKTRQGLQDYLSAEQDFLVSKPLYS